MAFDGSDVEVIFEARDFSKCFSVLRASFRSLLFFDRPKSPIDANSERRVSTYKYPGGALLGG